ncbi:low specificity L-threonine aldolase [Pelagibius litoralis]|uniref:Low specificity L-threonine aldolase n=1 Tax=Pelagibius litoralis TaxID=374515 RepID=A0A967C7A0_9PROT|nr:aminotransferase class I/II-fold pyridoxal phosphate-dependent enzyme [Pelagibius litoralis]NIA67887.1 low specificity L-threonine aldolase [Pelagibius litoralis]
MSKDTQFLVSLADDGDIPAPKEMAARLQRLTQETAIEADYYGNGGAVTELEAEAARLLGKERAVMFPTGTLANLIALRLLAGPDGARVVVHRHSHLFNDSGDNLSLLGGFTMVPLEGEGAGFSADDVAAELDRTADARVASRVGCIAMESPNRRLLGQRFAQADIKAITGLAGNRGIPLFLDGARMLIECAYSGQRPADMAAPFDIVYLSLYKYLGAPFGCVLAGSAAMLDGVFHDRRRFGGSLYQMWPAALLAKDALAGYAERWHRTRSAAEAVLALVEDQGPVTVEHIPDGTNIVRLRLPGAVLDGDKVKAAGLSQALKLPPPSADCLPVKINETWLNVEPQDLAGRLLKALGRCA